MAHQNTKKHKATHGNYYEKPSKKEVQANLNFWDQLFNTGGIENGEVTILFGTPNSGMPKIGTQLKLNL